MKTCRITEEQVALALKRVWLKTRIEDIYRDLGIREAMLCNWKKKFEGLCGYPGYVD